MKKFSLKVWFLFKFDDFTVVIFKLKEMYGGQEVKN